ncbi:HIRAN domain-containing protein [Spirulina sp. 06S082]|uniref:HIRAN domain-containing protein n=1 Tax=Spirulina sp. 06S082 TaxID=3110248 RepID=UPI002B212844|nr:HIRAN domain-containing protein [Spirulina sp. 06S082]MEA5468964.1 HIRAN domain-containing protein [Spirulina sp. 06S082]
MTISTLFLAWQDPQSRSWFPIGRLTFDGELYKFVYIEGARNAQREANFSLLHSFPELTKEYKSIELFPPFANRLMRPSRPDYNDYIQSLNIPRDRDDPIAIFSRSGGRKATDTFEIFPCPKPDENGLFHIHFFAHGLRHIPQCSRDRINLLQPNEQLYLANEFQNSYDSQALLLCTKDHHIVGYCPRYLATDTLGICREKPDLVHVHVERINPAPTPLQSRLLCNMTAEWPQESYPFSEREYQSIVPNHQVQTLTR